MQSGVELIGNDIHYATVAQVDACVVGHCTPPLALQIEHGGVVFGAVVRNKQGLGWIEDFDVVF